MTPSEQRRPAPSGEGTLGGAVQEWPRWAKERFIERSGILMDSDCTQDEADRRAYREMRAVLAGRAAC